METVNGGGGVHEEDMVGTKPNPLRRIDFVSAEALCCGALVVCLCGHCRLRVLSAACVCVCVGWSVVEEPFPLT